MGIVRRWIPWTRRVRIAQLVERCVDRKVYGVLPRCPMCGIGRLKVAYPRALGHGGMGTFTCPGGYDDDEYKRCSYRATTAERPAWVVCDAEAAAVAGGGKKSAGGGKSAAGGGKAKSTGAASPPAAAPATKSAPVRVAMPDDDD